MKNSNRPQGDFSRLVVIGPTSFDLIVRAAKGNSPPKVVAAGPGGCAFNVAWNCASQGLPVSLVTQDVQELPIGGGVPLPSLIGVQTIDNLMQGGWYGKFLALLDNEGEIIFSIADFAGAAEIFVEHVADTLAPLVASAEIVAVSSDVDASLWSRLAAGFAGRRGYRLCLLTAGVPLPPDYLEWCASGEIVFMSQKEASSLGMGGEEACERILGGGTELAFVTADNRGCYFAQGREKVQWQPAEAPVAAAVSAVGCGDAFAGGALVGLSRSEDLASCVRRGQLAALEVLGRAETTLPRIFQTMQEKTTSVRFT